MDLSIKRNSFHHEDNSTELLIQSSFSGPFEMPEGVESVSPAYLIQTKHKVEFKKDVDLKLHHNAHLKTEEDCKDMVFLKAKSTPAYRGQECTPFYQFEEIDDGSSAEFSSRWKFGKIKLSRLFSWFKIGRKQRNAEG